MPHGTVFELRNPITLVGILALLSLLNGCDRIVLNRQRPSPAFIVGDIDQDQEISREEWESVYGTNGLTRAVLEFDWGDCDRNGRLTWEEYFRVRARRQRCQSSPLETLMREAGQVTLHEEVLTPIISAKDIHLARVSLMRNTQRLVKAKFHEHYSEQDKVPGGLYLFTLSCGAVEQLEIPEISRDFRQFSRLALLKEGPHAAIRCTVTNNSRHTFTYLQLRLTTAFAEGEAEAFHGKSLWIPPRASRDLWIFPGEGQPVPRVMVAGFRVKQESRDIPGRL
jgi:hypothetical protein